MIDAWFAHVDRAMLAAVPPERLATMNIRGKITALVEARLALLAPNRESLRRAIAILALPRHVIRAGKLGWRAADVMRSEEHTSELQSLMRITYAVFCLT